MSTARVLSYSELAPPCSVVGLECVFEFILKVCYSAFNRDVEFWRNILNILMSINMFLSKI